MACSSASGSLYPVREHLQSIVLKRIVRSGNDNTGHEGIRAGQIGYAGGGDHAGEACAHTAPGQSAGHLRGQPRTGLARIHSNEHLGIRPQVRCHASQCHAKSVHGVGVERKLARHSSNAVCPE